MHKTTSITTIMVLILLLVGQGLGQPSTYCPLCLHEAYQQGVRDSGGIVSLPDAAEIVMLLDRSGSMADMKAEMEEAIGSFVAKQAKVNPSTRMTLIEFDDIGYYISVNRAPVMAVDRIAIEPRGRTPLLDALGRTMEDVSKRITCGKIIMVIITDGLENASINWSRDQVLLRVNHMRDKHGWEFIYLGANQDAIAVGSKIGIPLSLNYDATTLLTSVDCVSIATSNFILDGSIDANDLVITEPNNR